MLNNRIKNILYTIILTVAIFMIGLYFVFTIIQLLPGDPVLAFLPPSFTAEQYQEVYQRLGLNQPLFIQYFKFITMFISGEWGKSISLTPGQPVIELLSSRILVDLNFTVLPIILGTIIGMILGIYSANQRYKWVKYIVNIFIILGISIPVFSFGLFLNYFLAYQMDLFPSTGDPTLPGFILFLTTIALISRQFSSNSKHRPEEIHILPNTLKTIMNFGIIFAEILILEITFNLHGIAEAFLSSISFVDYWVVSTTISLLVVLTTIIILISNVCFTVYNYLVEKGNLKPLRANLLPDEELRDKVTINDDIPSEHLKGFIIDRIRSPLTIMGLTILGISIIFSIFPQIITPYSVEETLGIYSGPYNPPSSDHPLGQSLFGRDVLALLIYGVRSTLVLGIISVLIGLIGGLLLGYLSSLNKIIKLILIGLMVLMFTLPTIVIIIIIDGIFPFTMTILIPMIGIFLIPGSTLIFGEFKFRLNLIIKKIIIYLPLLMGFAVLFIEGLSFIRLVNEPIIQLGRNVSDARGLVSTAPWASFWPGVAIFVIAIGFFMLHYGLKEPLNKRKQI